MAKSASRSLRKLLRRVRSGAWRRDLLTAVAAWNNHQVARVVTAMVLTWLPGATAIHLAERRANPSFATWPDSLWNVWVLLFSGLSEPPKRPTAAW